MVKKYQLLTALLGLILIACLSCVEGQYVQYPEGLGSYTLPSPTSVGQTTPQTSQVGQTTNQYSQYYTMGPAPNTHITAPQQFNISGNTPTTIFFSYQRQPVAYSLYQSAPGVRNSLWIKGSDSWAQYAEVPQGAIVPLLAISPNGGNGYIRELDPNGQMYNYNYFFYPDSQLTFYADTPGRHTIHFGLAGQPSNHVEVDVIGTYKPPSYYNPPSFYYGYYPYLGWDDWWGDGGFFGFGDEFGEGEGFREEGEGFRGGEGFGGSGERRGGEGGRR